MSSWLDGGSGDSDDEDGNDRNLRGGRGFGGTAVRGRKGGFGGGTRRGSSGLGSPDDGKKLAVGSVANEANRPLCELLLKEVHKRTKFSTNDYAAKSMHSAYCNVKKYPLVITDGKMSLQINGVGKTTAKLIDDFLTKIRRSAPAPSSPPAPAPGPAAPHPPAQPASSSRVVPDSHVRPDDSFGADSGAPKAKKARVSHDVGLKELLQAGKLAIDQEITFRKVAARGAGEEIVETGRMTEAGEILYRGTTYKKPSGFAAAAWARGGGSGKIADGWGTVFAGDVSLKSMRDNLEGRQSASSSYSAPPRAAPRAEAGAGAGAEAGAGAGADYPSSSSAAPSRAGKKEWVPGEDTCGRALLIGLYRKKHGIGCAPLDGDGGIGKEDLAKFSERWCTASILKPAGGVAAQATFARAGAEHVNWFTGWTVMIKTMVPRGFVDEYRVHPKKFYRLTEKGEELAKRMHLEQVDPSLPTRACTNILKTVRTIEGILGQACDIAALIQVAKEERRKNGGGGGGGGGGGSQQAGDAAPNAPPRSAPPPHAPRRAASPGEKEGLSGRRGVVEERITASHMGYAARTPSPPPRASMGGAGGDSIVLLDTPSPMASNKALRRSGSYVSPVPRDGAAAGGRGWAGSEDGSSPVILLTDSPEVHKSIQRSRRDGLKGVVEERSTSKYEHAAEAGARGAGGGVEGKSVCPYGASCYRDPTSKSGAAHFREFDHPFPRSVEASGGAAAGEGRGGGSRDVGRKLARMMEGVSDSGGRGAEWDGVWDVVLIVDTSEPQDLKHLLSGEGVGFEDRRLECGDFLWMARQQRTGFEVVLNFIIERKQIDDFVQSMTGKRYESQKHRMLETGIQTKIYLVEGNPAEANLRPLPSGCDDFAAGHKTWEDRVRSATIETEIFNKFTSIKTDDLKGTSKLLRRLNACISRLVRSKGVMAPGVALVNPTTGEPVSLASFQEQMKHLKFDYTLRDQLEMMLFQAKGLGATSAELLAKHFATPAGLYDHVARCSTERECHDMLKAALKDEGGRMMSADAVANFWEAWGCGT